MSLLDSALVRLLPAVPKPVVQLFSSRYIAGATLAEAVDCVRELNAGGKMATVDVLGEEITREEETRAIAQAYRDVFAAIDEAALDSNVSVKLTALGLDLSYELCRENLLDVVRTAAGYGNFVRIDMEDSSTTDDTLRLYRELREDGHDNLGVVLQARLRRTLDDVARARRPAAERPALQGHLPRAGRDRVHRLRGGARELPRAASTRSSTPAATSASRRTTSG